MAYGGFRDGRWHLRWTRGSWYAPKESQAPMGSRVVLGPVAEWRGFVVDLKTNMRCQVPTQNI